MEVKAEDLNYLLANLYTCSGKFSHGENIDKSRVRKIASKAGLDFEWDESWERYEMRDKK